MAAITKEMAFDSSLSTGETMDDPAMPPAEPAEDSGETLSLDVFGGSEPAIGDKVTLEVTSVDPESGSVTVRLPSAKKAVGIAAKSAALDES